MGAATRTFSAATAGVWMSAAAAGAGAAGAAGAVGLAQAASE